MILSINFYFFYNLFKMGAFFKKKECSIFTAPLFGIQKDDRSGFWAYYLTGRRYVTL